MNHVRPILRLLCMRHGKTNYTGKFPDLTEEGVHQVNTWGLDQVGSWMKEYSIYPERVSIVSSPASRARGTASLIRDGIGHTEEIHVVEDIEPLRWKDPERCADVLKGMSGYINLETEPRFADQSLFEPLHEVHDRWNKYLKRSLETAVLEGKSRDIILIAHYETFCGIVKSLFAVASEQETELRHVEAIELAFYRGDVGRYFVQGCFRGIKVQSAFRVDGTWDSI